MNLKREDFLIMKKVISIAFTLVLSLGILSPIAFAKSGEVKFDLTRRHLSGDDTGNYHNLKKGTVVLKTTAYTDYSSSISYTVQLVQSKDWAIDKYYSSKKQKAGSNKRISNSATWSVSAKGKYYLIFDKGADHVRLKGDGTIKNK